MGEGGKEPMHPSNGVPRRSFGHVWSRSRKPHLMYDFPGFLRVLTTDGALMEHGLHCTPWTWPSYELNIVGWWTTFNMLCVLS
jgi:hypothetical protein